MNRRGLLLALAIIAGVIVPGLSRAAQPCPPPRVDVEGGTSASTDCGTSTGYSTTFPNTENPLSEGGKWINGKVVGGNWNNVQSVTGKAFAAQFVSLGASRYDDDIAVLNTTFTANQFAEGRVFRTPGYMSSDHHEIELLLRFSITSGNAHGYEILWAQEGNMAIVRWNGPLGDYDALLDGIPGSPAVDGDVLRAEIIGNVITVFKNGTQVATVNVTSAGGTVWSTGQPGMGFWPLPGATLQNYGWKSYRAGNR